MLDAAEDNHNLIQCIHMCFHQHVYVHEDMYLYYTRKLIMHFEVSHSSQHEVSHILIFCLVEGLFLIIFLKETSFGFKKHSAPMQSTMNMATSLKTPNIQSNLKVQEIEEIIFQDYNFCNKTWSSLPTSPYTTTVAEVIIADVMACTILHSCKRIDFSKFQVNFHGDCDGDNQSVSEINDNNYIKSSPIPLLENVHTVSIDSYRDIFCDCCSFETTRIFWVHVVQVCQHLAKSCTLTFLGFTHRDITIHWTSAYMHLAYKKPTPRDSKSLRCTSIQWYQETHPPANYSSHYANSKNNSKTTSSSTRAS